MTERVIRVTLDPSGTGTGASVVEGNLNRIDRSRQRVQSGFESLRRIVLAVIGSVVIREILQYADAWQTVANRLALVANSQSQLNALQRETFGIAQRTRSDLTATADLYGRLSRAAGEYGLSQRAIAGITETVNQAIQVSGAAATEATATIRQLGQALGRGELRGDELISILENAPRLSQAIADTMGVAVGQVSQLGKEGKITGDILIESLQKQAPKIAEEFARLTPTISSAFTVLRNDVTKFIGEAVGSTRGLHDAIVETGRGFIGMARGFGIAWRSVADELGGDGSFLEAFKESAGEILPIIGRSLQELPITIRFAVERAVIEIASFLERLETRVKLAVNGIRLSVAEFGEDSNLAKLGKAFGVEPLQGLSVESLRAERGALERELAGERGGRQSSIDDINARYRAAIAELDGGPAQRSRDEAIGAAADDLIGQITGRGRGPRGLSEEDELDLRMDVLRAGEQASQALGGRDRTPGELLREDLEAIRESERAWSEYYKHLKDQEEELAVLRERYARNQVTFVDTVIDATKSAYDDLIRTGQLSARSFIQFLIAEFSRKEIFKALDAIGDAIRKNLSARAEGGGGGFLGFLGSIVGGFLGRGASGGLEEFTPNLPPRLPEPGGFEHYAQGGDFIVGGPPGIDRTRVDFMASRGERVTITPPGRSMSPAPAQINVTNEFKIDARGSTKEGAEELANRMPAVLEEYGERWKQELAHEIKIGAR